MRNDDLSGIGEDRRLENFAWMGDRRRQVADTDGCNANQVVLRVQHQAHEMFSVCVLQEFGQEPGDIFRALYEGLVVQWNGSGHGQSDLIDRNEV